MRALLASWPSCMKGDRATLDATQSARGRARLGAFAPDAFHSSLAFLKHAHDTQHVLTHVASFCVAAQELGLKGTLSCTYRKVRAARRRAPSRQCAFIYWLALTRMHSWMATEQMPVHRRLGDCS